jgi:hypothetical protein
MSDPVIIRKNDDGTIDEIVAKDCTLHIEQMTNDGWYIGVTASDGSYWQFWIGAKNGRSAVEVRHTETSPALETYVKALLRGGV